MLRLRIRTTHIKTRLVLLSTCFLFFFKINFAQAPVINSFSPIEAHNGQQVVIKGHGFMNTSEIWFGGVNTPFFRLPSDTMLIALISGGASGEVKVITPLGTGTLPGFIYLPPIDITSVSPLTGKFGDTINIYGVNLAEVDSVSFGGMSALSFTIVSSTHIKAVAGNGSSGNVYVGDKFSSDLIGGFIHNAPAIDSFLPRGIAPGLPIKIYGKQFTGISAVKFAGIPAISFNVISDTLISAIAPGDKIGDVQVISTKGTATKAGFNLPVITSFDPYLAGYGNTVNIYGYNFTGVTDVIVGNTAALSFQLINDSLIKAIVGDATTAPLKVIKQSIEVIAPSTFVFGTWYPKITAVSPAIFTGGTQVMIRGNAFGQPTAVRFGNTPAVSYQVTSQTNIYADTLIAIAPNGSASKVYVENGHQVDSFNIMLYVGPPVITDMQPLSGQVGSTVRLSGTNMSTVPEENIVYFGTVRAEVIAADGNGISVKVPAGAGYMPITVTNHGATGYSSKPFDIIFPGAGPVFASGSFAERIIFKTNTPVSPEKTIAADFDMDGKTDVAVCYGYVSTGINYISVFKNISINDEISFSGPQNIVVADNTFGFDIETGDIDGDGKPDLVVLNGGLGLVSILKNTSIPGSISFATGKNYVTGNTYGPDGTNPQGLTINDFDLDGKPDLAFANFGLDNWCKFTYMRNNTFNSSIDFSPHTDRYIVDASLTGSSDLNNDRLPDIAVGIRVNGNFMQQMNILKNTSTGIGAISFQQNESVGLVNSYPPSICVFADLDGDGKTDMVTGNYGSYLISVFKNKSLPGGPIEFEPNFQVTAGNNVKGITINDFDGDGKPDIAVAAASANTVALLKNVSVGGTISFAEKVDYPVGQFPLYLTSADLDGDGKPELIIPDGAENSFSVLKNMTGADIGLCPTAASTDIVSNITGSSYQWQQSADGTNYSDLSNGTFYGGTQSAALHLVNIPSSFTGYSYRCKVDGNNSFTYKIKFKNTWVGGANSSWSNPANWSCGVVPDIYTAVVIRSGTVIVDSPGGCKSLTLLPGVSFTVQPGISFVITD